MYQPESSSNNTPNILRNSDNIFEGLNRRSHAEIRAENRQIFVRVYEDYSASLTKRLTSLIGNRETALELCQETFTRAWKEYFIWSGPILEQTVDGFERLLNRIGYNLAIDELRRTRRITFEFLPGDEPNEPKERALSKHPSLSVEGHEEQVCDRSLIEAALAAMSERYRECVLLQDDWGLTQPEIAVKLGIDVNTVSSNISRGYKQLRTICAKLLSEHGTTAKGGRERYGKTNLRSF